MSHIYYKFQSSNDHDIVKFDGLSISLTELKSLILAKSKVAGSTDFSLQITNAQTKEGLCFANIPVRFIYACMWHNLLIFVFREKTVSH